MRRPKTDRFGLFRLTHVVLILGLIGAGVAAATEGEMYKGYELPPYEVLESEGPFERRSYRPHILAEVTVRGGQGRAVSRGFQVLANYIFGGKATGEKIAMTVPVAQTPNEGAASPGEGWTVSFMMPAAFTLETLPDAQNGAIRFVEAKPEEMLVLSFSGMRTAGALARQTQALIDEAQARQLTMIGAPRYFFYDGPMTPPWARRNEVAVPILPGAAG
ncbi:MAG: heme-binding protein [Pseudomonadota bacterium]